MDEKDSQQAPESPQPAAEASPAEPDRPMLRPLEAFPVDNPSDPRNPKLLALRDPSGLTDEVLTLPPMGAAVVGLLEGELTRDEICGEFEKQFRAPLRRDSLDALLQRLDDALMLESPRFRDHATRLYSEFNSSEVRPARLAGRSYPADAGGLQAHLEGCFAPPNGPGLPPADSHLSREAPPHPRAIVAPHIDFSRGGPAYAWAYRPLLVCRDLPDIIVLLGTNHNSLDATFTFTRKHFETPLGTLETDVELLGELLDAAEKADEKLPQHLIYDEHQHRGEHSLEFQAVWLSYVLMRRGQAQGTKDPDNDSDEAAARRPKILPFLCGSFHDFATGSEKHGQHDPMLRPNIPPFFQVLGEVLKARQQAGQRVMWLCSADLAHVGPRYGDRDPIRGEDHESLDRRDRETLRKVVAGDADGWLDEIRRERDRRRVCGLAPIYTFLKVSGLHEGQLRCYAQCQAEAGSIVSIASVLFP